MVNIKQTARKSTRPPAAHSKLQTGAAQAPNTAAPNASSQRAQPDSSQQTSRKETRSTVMNSQLRAATARGKQPVTEQAPLPTARPDSPLEEQVKVTHGFFCRDNEQLYRYDKVCESRPLRPTKFIDIPDLKALGLYEDVKTMCLNSGF
jgi:hypothetical protein